MLKVIETVNDLFQKLVEYHTYRLIKKLARYNDNVAHELHRMAKKTVIQMKNGTFSGQDLMSVVAFLQDCKSPCDVLGIHEGQQCSYSNSALLDPPRVL